MDPKNIVGFYSLSAFTIALDALPEALSTRLPRYDQIPAALIGRLARSVLARGKGIGELLVADAIKRVLAAGEALGIYAMVVDAKNDGASRFYQSLGFAPFPETHGRLFLLTETAKAAIAAVDE